MSSRASISGDRRPRTVYWITQISIILLAILCFYYLFTSLTLRNTVGTVIETRVLNSAKQTLLDTWSQDHADRISRLMNSAPPLDTNSYSDWAAQVRGIMQYEVVPFVSIHGSLRAIGADPLVAGDIAKMKMNGKESDTAAERLDTLGSIVRRQGELTSGGHLCGYVMYTREYDDRTWGVVYNSFQDWARFLSSLSDSAKERVSPVTASRLSECFQTIKTAMPTDRVGMRAFAHHKLIFITYGLDTLNYHVSLQLPDDRCTVEVFMSDNDQNLIESGSFVSTFWPAFAICIIALVALNIFYRSTK